VPLPAPLAVRLLPSELPSTPPNDEIKRGGIIVGNAAERLWCREGSAAAAGGLLGGEAVVVVVGAGVGAGIGAGTWLGGKLIRNTVHVLSSAKLWA